jgi:polyisoprenoid-binding protein YceI
VFHIVSQSSRVVVEVGKSGALSFAAGHTHKVEGPVSGRLAFVPEEPERADITIAIQTADLRVRAEGEPPGDVPEIQETMASARVLDVARYPTIAFQSRTVVLERQHGSALDLKITGDLTLHGATHLVTIPVMAEANADQVTARGRFSIKQSEYGIAPVRVAGGLVSVKDTLEIELRLVARAEPR